MKNFRSVKEESIFTKCLEKALIHNRNSTEVIIKIEKVAVKSDGESANSAKDGVRSKLQDTPLSQRFKEVLNDNPGCLVIGCEETRDEERSHQGMLRRVVEEEAGL